MSEYVSICAELNIPLKEDKTMSPVSVLTYLGFEIDKVEMKKNMLFQHEKGSDSRDGLVLCSLTLT